MDAAGVCYRGVFFLVLFLDNSVGRDGGGVLACCCCSSRVVMVLKLLLNIFRPPDFKMCSIPSSIL